ncbi:MULTISPECIES: Wzz/FepE/Etk N-terminal domain-containing protein [Pseudomonas]|uniref:Chain-length determining protein n=1 Tax=Pseudomonas plecoglossicida TaxID=70775 RepID=A0ABX4U065_PSEDL|nr:MULTISPECIES: Wzz/FepE/Etk N-terminal domain-containing protein [Pseudomonas]PLU85966.1 chain-length determining protein [Pseudomonas plecoglossicida]PLU90511.1 chain-length determining protein [Pseudomonas plecoglossicida]PLV00110.1 chain-length determining protein [Pseudomonas plecoglossicida]PLV11683.1 chain-length determining protein [Pseudomonas plecoglossicida]
MKLDPRGSYRDASGEVDLFDLFRIIWRRRAFIVAIGVFFAIIGVALAYVIPPEYEASTTLRPVELNQLDALNRSKIYSLPPEEALKRVGARLDSYNARLEYFRSRPEIVEAFRDGGQSFEQAFQGFNSTALSVVQADPKKGNLLSDFIGLKMRYGKDINGAAVLNDFVDYAVELERAQLSRDMQIILANRLAEVDAKLNSALTEYRTGNEGRIARLEESDTIKRAQLNDELKALRVQLRLQRQARLAELDEAISIARSLGLKKPSTPSLMADEVSGGGNIIRTEVNGRPVPLYFMGTEVLEAERATLRKRTSDDFVAPRIGEIRKELLLLSNNRSVEAIKARVNDQDFLEGVEALRAERVRLQAINTELQGLQLVSIDQRAVAAAKPLKPRKALIVMFAFVCGLLLGAIIALVRAAFKNNLRRMRTAEVGGAVAVVLPEDLSRQVNVLLPEAQIGAAKK